MQKLGMDKLVFQALGTVWLAIVDHIPLARQHVKVFLLTGHKIPVLVVHRIDCIQACRGYFIRAIIIFDQRTCIIFLS